MRIISVYFNDSFDRYAKVFRLSVKDTFNCEPEIYKLPDVANDWRLWNTIKLRKWNELVQHANDDIFLCDIDLMFTEKFDPFITPFDIGITHSHAGRPYNGGLIFVRNSDKAKSFIQRLTDVNEEMFTDNSFHIPYKKIYAGINQAAMGYLLENGARETFDIKEFDCAIYNACRPRHWINTDCKVIHFKSQIRRAVEGVGKPPAGANRWLEMFDKYENMADNQRFA